MGRCGATTRKGTPCKLPGTRNGRCWLHEDKQGERPESLLKIQSVQGAEEELSIDLFDAPDNVLDAYFSTRHKDLSVDPVDDHDAVFNESDFDSDEELSFDFLGAPDSPLSVSALEPDEASPLIGARYSEGRLFGSGAGVKSPKMGTLRKEQPKPNSVKHHAETVPPMENQGREENFLPAEKEQGNGYFGKKEIFISVFTLAAIIFLILFLM